MARGLVWVVWCVATAAAERWYTMTVEGCGVQNYSLSSLGVVSESQRRVWEELGLERPWWSVLSSADYDGVAELDDVAAQSFYESGEAAVGRALAVVDVAAARSSSASDRLARLPWAGGGIGAVRALSWWSV